MKINGKEVTVGQIASVLTIITVLTAGGFFLHGYFAKTADLQTLQIKLDTYKVEQEKTVLQLKQNAQIEVWTTEQTFIVIRKDTILDRMMVEGAKEQTDARDRQLDRWQGQLDDHTIREREIKKSKEDLKIQMLTP